MTLDDIIEEYREDSHDSGSPPFISDEWLTKRANQGEKEACRRAGLITESVHAMCSVSVAAGDPVVPLDPRIINIKKARLALDSQPLCPVRSDQLSFDWESETGTPSHYVTDYQSGAIRLYPSPTVNDDLLLTVTRLPLKDMASGEDKPEIREEYHDALVQWVLYRAYGKQDADIFDPAKAAKALALFEREFGRKSSARNEEWTRQRHEIDAAPIA